MVTINGNTYGVCLLDTNALSEFVRRPTQDFRHFLDWEPGGLTLIPSFSLFSVIELRRRPSLYREFLTLFNDFPCVILKGHEQLLEEEVAAYPNPASIDPLLVALPGRTVPSELRLLDLLDRHFTSAEGAAQERKWLDGAKPIVDGMTELVANYPPDGRTYTPREVRTFVEIAGFSQIAMRAGDFARRTVEAGNAVDIDAFPSIKFTAFTVFYKFYVDGRRAPATSDAFDVMISSPTPYVDAVVTERHQVEVIRKTKRRDDFIAHVAAHPLRDFRDGPPEETLQLGRTGR